LVDNDIISGANCAGSKNSALLGRICPRADVKPIAARFIQSLSSSPDLDVGLALYAPEAMDLFIAVVGCIALDEDKRGVRVLA
jgi:hypothetical protein